MRIGILLPNWIGDVCMATPTLRAVRNHFRSAEIAGIMRPYVAKVLDGTDWLDKSFFCERRSDKPELRGAAVLQQLRRWRPDLMLLLTNSLWGGWLAFRSGAAQRIGYVRNGRGILLTAGLKPPREGRKLKPIPAIDYFLELAYAAGCPPESPRMELSTVAADEHGADRAWTELGLSSARRVITFNAGSAVGSAKHWSQENYVELARRITRDSDRAVLVLCGPGEREVASAIERAAAHPRVRSMARQDLGLGVAKACVRRSDLMVTTDSGPRHFAPAFGVPVVTLFGPVDAAWTDSHFPGAVNLMQPVDCRPCGHTVCPLADHPCMTGITVDRVFAAVQDQLRRLDRTAA